MVVATFEFVISAALLQAGMVHMTYRELPGHLTRAVELVVE